MADRGRNTRCLLALVLGISVLFVSFPGGAPPAGASGGGGSSPADEALPAPQWVGATARGGNVLLSWVLDRRFAAVRVYRSSAETGWAFVLVGEARENFFTDAAVSPGGSYRYRLAAIGPGGVEGRYSAEVSVGLSATKLRPPTVPVWEGFLTVEDGVGLKWRPQEGADILVYNVYRRTPPEPQFQLIASVRDTSFVDTRVEADKPMLYVLTALDSALSETPFSEELPVVYRRPRTQVERKAAAEWRPRRTRLVAMVGGGDQPFLRPADIAVGPLSGNVYLSDSGRNRIFVLDGNGKFLRSLGGAPGSATAFGRLLGIAVDPGETVYAVDAGQEVVLAFPEGAGTGRRVDMPQPKPGLARGLVDCVATGEGRLYLIDNRNNRIVVLGKGATAESIGGAGFKPGEFSAPTFATTDGAGNLLVADTLNGRVQVFSFSGEFLMALGRSEGGGALLGRPKGIAVRAGGEIFVADSWLNAISVFGATGQPVALLVDEEGKPLDLGSPNGIALGPGNRIYIAERLSARLQIREFIDEAR